MNTKSKGQSQFERELAELERRMECGEIKNPLEPGQELERIVRDAKPKMTTAERADLERVQLGAHQLGAEILADHGQPLPGNDPKKPN